MPTVMIPGASRGIGLEFVRQYAPAGWKVLACCRKPGTATDLNRITGDVSLFALDVDNDANIASLARQLDSVPIDVLINNAGISKPEASTLGQISSEVWLQVFRTNTIAPLKMAEAFLSNLEAGKEKKLIAISSRLGSIELNDGGRRYEPGVVEPDALNRLATRSRTCSPSASPTASAAARRARARSARCGSARPTTSSRSPPTRAASASRAATCRRPRSR